MILTGFVASSTISYNLDIQCYFGYSEDNTPLKPIRFGYIFERAMR